ncbi:DUF4865 family protein [Deinococcus hopiensis]|uniref:DUF4865 domain-containing protein n=1 Tax=Deinococcus hopiensis KR-140 TaxID=695939 RepID=A0A1W1UQ01_9DEIO|nr:DUF4865 family protein [Deinococcus hopiensis]SMB83182.1 protein of unknown function [Deinococcus hopiensis KR-140]
MHAMQYEFTLPADYDMQIIRHRVATKGHATDQFPGLGLKAYCVRFRGEQGSTIHQYAPFYLWANPDGISQFLLGEGFKGLSGSFGRPAVRRYIGLQYLPGQAATQQPVAASRRTDRIPPDDELHGVLDRHLAQALERAALSQVYATAVAFDPQAWEIVHFTLWTDVVPNEDDVQYAVLHVSQPGIDQLYLAPQAPNLPSQPR